MSTHIIITRLRVENIDVPEMGREMYVGVYGEYLSFCAALEDGAGEFLKELPADDKELLLSIARHARFSDFDEYDLQNLLHSEGTASHFVIGRNSYSNAEIVKWMKEIDQILDAEEQKMNDEQ
ncbi:TPA: hypothetical protein DDW35_02425 [Candidatus Sumerlaeota bacterium]|jgi:hypothetical protein|nr:hypothetical protein [Candidatus Sumerlaeota bacterium]